jgi:hypothetical protein
MLEWFDPSALTAQIAATVPLIQRSAIERMVCRIAGS